MRLNSLSFNPNLALRLGAPRSGGITSQQATHSVGQALCLSARMGAEAAPMQPSLHCGRLNPTLGRFNRREGSYVSRSQSDFVIAQGDKIGVVFVDCRNLTFSRRRSI